MGEPGRETLYDPLADEEVDGDGIPVFGYLPLRNFEFLMGIEVVQ